MKNFEKSTLMNTCNDIQSIASPLKTHFDITYFGYVKSYSDSTHLALSTSADWMKCFYENFHTEGLCHRTINNYTTGSFLWSCFASEKILTIMCNQFNLGNGIVIIKKHVDCCEFFAFGTHANNYCIENWYLSNMDMLERFTLFFKDRAGSLIKDAENDRLILPIQSKKALPKIMSNTVSVNSNSRSAFIEETSSNINKLPKCEMACLESTNTDEFTLARYYLGNKPESEYLTRKEIVCAAKIINGLTIKEVAKLLKLSPRTIETHLNHVKQKMRVNSLIEMSVQLSRKLPHLVKST